MFIPIIRFTHTKKVTCCPSLSRSSVSLTFPWRPHYPSHSGSQRLQEAPVRKKGDCMHTLTFIMLDAVCHTLQIECDICRMLPDGMRTGMKNTAAVSVWICFCACCVNIFPLNTETNRLHKSYWIAVDHMLWLCVYCMALYLHSSLN